MSKMGKTKQEKKGIYVVVDAMDYAGKGTQIRLLQKTLLQFSGTAVFTREPGGTPYAEIIRNTILAPLANGADPYTEFLLFWAARTELIRNVIAPALRDGKIVVSDRADSSTWAFQLYGREHRSWRAEFMRMRKQVIGAWEPDIYIILDLPVNVVLARREKNKRHEDNHFDKETAKFYERVRYGFQQLPAYSFPAVLIDADASEEKVHERVWKALSIRFPLYFPKL